MGIYTLWKVQVERQMAIEYDDVNLIRKGVHHMFLGHEHIWYNDLNNLEDNYYPYPSYSQNVYSSEFNEMGDGQWIPFYDGRIFPHFGPTGTPPSGPPGPPPSQGGFSGFPTTGPGTVSGPPTAPPPSFVPTQQVSAFAVDPGGIRRCLFRYTYVWLNNGQQFWFYPVFVGRTSVSGYRWNGFRWLFFGVSLRQIQSFTCV